MDRPGLIQLASYKLIFNNVTSGNISVCHCQLLLCTLLETLLCAQCPQCHTSGIFIYYFEYRYKYKYKWKYKYKYGYNVCSEILTTLPWIQTGWVSGVLLHLQVDKTPRPSLPFWIRQVFRVWAGTQVGIMYMYVPVFVIVPHLSRLVWSKDLCYKKHLLSSYIWSMRVVWGERYE